MKNQNTSALTFDSFATSGPSEHVLRSPDVDRILALISHERISNLQLSLAFLYYFFGKHSKYRLLQESKAFRQLARNETFPQGLFLF